jgi:predicted nucleic acid-binding protein
MAFLLDTNALSEILKKDPNENVVNWFDQTHESEQYICVFTIGEIQKGISKLASSRRKGELQSWFDQLVVRYNGRTLPFVLETAITWARMVAELERRGRVLPMIDSLIAAVALEHNLTIVTNNTRDFADTKASVLNIWD